MKIVHICLCGPVTDGWTYQENMITKYQKKNGHDVTILTSKWIWGTNGKMELDSRTSYENQDGVKMVRLPMKFREDFRNKFKQYVGLKEALEAENPEILFIHGVGFCDIRVLVRYLKAHPQVRTYADNHADLTNSGTNWVSKNILHKVIWRHYANLLVPYVRKFYGVLPVRVDFLTELYHLPKEKCELLVMGADDEEVEKAADPGIAGAIREKYGIREDDFLIMTGGKIDQWKTQTLLLMEAVQKIANPKVRLIVFGSVADELKARVDTLADGNKIQYIGWVQAIDTYQYVAASDLMVFPGRHSVFWEQVAGQGKPMLVKDLPGTHHVDLGGNVRFLTQDSAEEIQTQIEDLMEHPEEYRKMKRVAEEKGMKTFSYRNIAKRAIEE